MTKPITIADVRAAFHTLAIGRAADRSGIGRDRVACYKAAILIAHAPISILAKVIPETDGDPAGVVALCNDRQFIARCEAGAHP